nr:Chain A, Cadmium-specific carbonic anhydrase [Conticribra weissflogii]3BOC_A Chain A, Cadmium-specific carbonic anhydrase [Conticribra weissflogii]3BOE_A Chain A, Cadmium-specific carbonic anhydrase [Conticribra weissflogii]
SISPAQIAEALQGRGWDAEIVTDASMAGQLVDVRPEGILKCVDGRGSDNTRMGGPKMPGGIYAIAHNRGVTSIEGLKQITKEVASKGHLPSVHGDHSSDMLGCGFFKLWVTGRFDDMGYPRPQFDADQGANAVKDAGGIIEMHHGSHTEKVVYINLLANKTLEPNENDQRFIVDGWAADKFGLDVPKFLIAAAATVEMLGGPKNAKIVVP